MLGCSRPWILQLAIEVVTGIREPLDSPNFEDRPCTTVGHMILVHCSVIQECTESFSCTKSGSNRPVALKPGQIPGSLMSLGPFWKVWNIMDLSKVCLNLWLIPMAFKKWVVTKLSFFICSSIQPTKWCLMLSLPHLRRSIPDEIPRRLQRRFHVAQ